MKSGKATYQETTNRTSITANLLKLLNIQEPILAAPIGSLVSPEMLGAIAKEGSIGFLPVTWMPCELYKLELQSSIELTAKQVGVNFVLCQINRDDLLKKIEFALLVGIKIFSFSWGHPEQYLDLIEKIHDNKGYYIHTVDSKELAEAAIKAKADVLIAQGREAGGHVLGNKALSELLPEIIEVTRDRNIPVIAAGGIAHGEQLLTIQKIGAAGAQLGTALIVATESRAHDVYKQAVIKATSEQTLLTSQIYIRDWIAPLRVIKNETTEACLNGKKQDGKIIASFPDARPICSGSDIPPLHGMTGEIYELPFYAGTGVDHVKKEQSIAGIFEQFREQYYHALVNIEEIESVKATKLYNSKEDRSDADMASEQNGTTKWTERSNLCQAQLFEQHSSVIHRGNQPTSDSSTSDTQAIFRHK